MKNKQESGVRRQKLEGNSALPKCKPVFAWPGGKTRLAPHIIPLIPPHELFVDVFCGALGFFLAKPPSRAELINDFNGELVSFFRVVKYHEMELQRELRFVTNSRADFFAYAEQPGLTDIQRAARWFIRLKNSFGGGGRSWAVQRKGGGGSNVSLANKKDLLRLLADRLDSVTVENRDWRRCLELYDAPQTLFFLDPPYVAGDCDNYAAWPQSSMVEMREVLRKIKGQWILTINDNPDNRALFADCTVQGVSRQRGICNKKADERQAYLELIITPIRKS